MRKIIFFIVACWLVGGWGETDNSLFAINSMYEFVSTKWETKVGTIKTDGKTDGWTSDKDASDYNAGRYDAENRLYSAGVGVKTGTTGAGATSVLSFQNVRKIIVNFCQNASKGKGEIILSVGERHDTINVYKPVATGSGVYNRDSIIIYETPETGNITFSVNCTENGIYINTITVYADNGSPNNPDVTTKIFKLITSHEQLRDGDEVMFGVRDTEKKWVMGEYYEEQAKNNIWAESGTYNTDHTIVNGKDGCIYTVEMHDGYPAFVDSYGWYLVASGGNPTKSNNNYLTVWTNYTSENFGDYGLWEIITDNDTLKVKSRGKSRSNVIHYNPNYNGAHNNIFACYQYCPDRGAAAAVFKKNDPTDIVTHPVTDKKLSQLFNLSGQTVGDDYKGIVIDGGKKRLKL